MGRNELHRLMEQSSFPERKMVAIIRDQLLAGHDIECMDVFGKTPLHRAAELGKAAALRALIANGASVSSRTRDGLTAMHLAAGNGHADVVKQVGRFLRRYLSQYPLVQAPPHHRAIGLLQ